MHWCKSDDNAVLGHWDPVAFCFGLVLVLLSSFVFLRVQHQTLEDPLVYKQSLSIASRKL